MSHTIHFPFHLGGLRLEILVGVLAAVVAVDAGMLAYAETPGGFLHPAVDRISSVTWTFNGTEISQGPALNARPDTSILLTLVDTNCYLGCAAIDFSAVEVTPASFTFVAASLPSIPPGDTGNLTVTLITPSGGYSGPLVLNLS